MKLWQYIFLLIGLLSMPVGVALADHIGDGINFIPILVTNNTGEDAAGVEVPAVLSSQTLINGSYMAADGLDTDMREADHVPYMPGTDMVQMLACFDNSGNDETVDCNDAGANDITLPAAGAEVFEFAADNQFRHLWLDIGTAAVADWTITWEYWNGSSYVALSNVTDETNGFETGGLSRVSWDFPAATQWPESTLHSISGYWVRARVSTFTSITTAPLGTQAWYETGRWWTLAQTIGADEQKRFELHLDVADSEPVTETFSITAGEDDGRVQGGDAAYPPPFDVADDTESAIIVSRNLQPGPAFRITLGLVRFDTSSLPDAIDVTDASITCHVRALTDTDSRNLVWEWFNWDTSLGGRHYETVAQANAHSGTAISALPSATLTSHTFTLTNTHLINKAGYTGLRVAVDGGMPTGNNTVQMSMFESQGCQLEVTYTAPKDYHYYFPHEDGYTLPDAAALEPGANYHLRWAGYWFITDNDPPLDTAFFAKNGADFRLRVTDDPFRVALDVNGMTNVLVSPSPSPLVTTGGYHVIDVYQNDEAVTLMVDGEQMDTASPITVTDNMADWILMNNNVSPGMEYFEIEVDQSTQLTHQLRDIPDHELIDQTGNGFDAIARYPDTGAATGFTVSLQSTKATQPVGGAEPEPGPEVIGDIPAIDDYSDTPDASGEGWWGWDVLCVFTCGLIPYQALTGIIGFAVPTVGGVIAARWLRHPVLFGLVIIALSAIMWRMGAIPGWTVFLFGMIIYPYWLQWKRHRP